MANVYRRLDGIQELFPLGPGKLASTPGPIPGGWPLGFPTV